jgi:hypothetical protein
VRLRLSEGMTFAGTPSDTTTVQGHEVVVTLGRLGVSSAQTIQIPVQASSDTESDEQLRTVATVYSSTVLPVHSNAAFTRVSH